MAPDSRGTFSSLAASTYLAGVEEAISPAASTTTTATSAVCARATHFSGNRTCTGNGISGLTPGSGCTSRRLRSNW